MGFPLPFLQKTFHVLQQNDPRLEASHVLHALEDMKPMPLWTPSAALSSKRRICRAWKSSNVDVAGLASLERPIEEIPVQFFLFGC